MNTTGHTIEPDLPTRETSLESNAREPRPFPRPCYTVSFSTHRSSTVGVPYHGLSSLDPQRGVEHAVERGVIGALQMRRRHRRDAVPAAASPHTCLYPCPTRNPAASSHLLDALAALEPTPGGHVTGMPSCAGRRAVGLDVREDTAGLVDDAGDALGDGVEGEPRETSARTSSTP